MKEKVDGTREQRNSFGLIFSIYMKTGRKRFISIIVTSAIIFLALTIFFMTWYSTKTNMYRAVQEEDC